MLLGDGLPRRRCGHRTDQLWLVYLGYGVIGGIGLGIGYISPVSTLIKWFPDRPGLATGMAIMGFGGGAMIATRCPRAAQRVRRQHDAATGIAAGSAVSTLFLTLAIGLLRRDDVRRVPGARARRRLEAARLGRLGGHDAGR